MVTEMAGVVTMVTEMAGVVTMVTKGMARLAW